MADRQHHPLAAAVVGTLQSVGSDKRKGGVRGPCKAVVVIADEDGRRLADLLIRDGAAAIVPLAELQRIDRLVRQAQAALRRAEIRGGKHTTEHAEALMDADDALVSLQKGIDDAR